MPVVAGRLVLSSLSTEKLWNDKTVPLKVLWLNSIKAKVKHTEISIDDQDN